MDDICNWREKVTIPDVENWDWSELAADDPDIYMYSDDIAKADGLFMQPDTYREIFKPGQTRIMKAIHDLGMISQQHTCGKCEDVMGDYVEARSRCKSHSRL